MVITVCDITTLAKDLIWQTATRPELHKCYERVVDLTPYILDGISLSTEIDLR